MEADPPRRQRQPPSQGETPQRTGSKVDRQKTLLALPLNPRHSPAERPERRPAHGVRRHAEGEGQRMAQCGGVLNLGHGSSTMS